MQLSVPRRSCSRLVIPRACPMRALLRAQLRRQPTSRIGLHARFKPVGRNDEISRPCCRQISVRAQAPGFRKQAQARSPSRDPRTDISPAESSRHGRRWVHSSRRCRQPRAYFGRRSHPARQPRVCAQLRSRQTRLHRKWEPGKHISSAGFVADDRRCSSITTRYKLAPLSRFEFSTMQPLSAGLAFCGSWPRLYLRTRGSDRM